MGIEQMGGQYIKTDGIDLFFNIKIGSDIDDDVKLKRAKDAFFKMFGLGLRIRRVNIA